MMMLFFSSAHLQSEIHVDFDFLMGNKRRGNQFVCEVSFSQFNSSISLVIHNWFIAFRESRFFSSYCALGNIFKFQIFLLLSIRHHRSGANGKRFGGLGGRTTIKLKSLFHLTRSQLIEIERKLNANDFTQRLIEGESHKIFPRALKAPISIFNSIFGARMCLEENLSLGSKCFRILRRQSYSNYS